MDYIERKEFNDLKEKVASLDNNHSEVLKRINAWISEKAMILGGIGQENFIEPKIEKLEAQFNQLGEHIKERIGAEMGEITKTNITLVNIRKENEALRGALFLIESILKDVTEGRIPSDSIASDLFRKLSQKLHEVKESSIRCPECGGLPVNHASSCSKEREKEKEPSGEKSVVSLIPRQAEQARELGKDSLTGGIGVQVPSTDSKPKDYTIDTSNCARDSHGNMCGLPIFKSKEDKTEIEKSNEFWQGYNLRQTELEKETDSKSKPSKMFQKCEECMFKDPSPECDECDEEYSSFEPKGEPYDEPTCKEFCSQYMSEDCLNVDTWGICDYFKPIEKGAAAEPSHPFDLCYECEDLNCNGYCSYRPEDRKKRCSRRKKWVEKAEVAKDINAIFAWIDQTKQGLGDDMGINGIQLYAGIITHLRNLQEKLGGGT